MATANRDNLPQPTPPEQADRVLTPEQKRELTIDTMANWALAGIEPNPQTPGEHLGVRARRAHDGGIPEEAEGGVTRREAARSFVDP